MQQLNDESQRVKRISDRWQEVKKHYSFKEYLGVGSFGTVLKATHRETKQTVAIKCIENFSESSYLSRQVLREIILLRKLSQIKENAFTTKLVDIILPEEIIYEESK